ncbi:Uncharacterized protein ChrSV_4631 [Chromobacterium vaccinii]|nr:Uncharacterized protein ChrSW_4631 [Chromobacterium vaccinii]QND92087.1 Uncharacterized protein ChrSV_4631 [Chromobacterium vaccinii]
MHIFLIAIKLLRDLYVVKLQNWQDTHKPSRRPDKATACI